MTARRLQFAGLIVALAIAASGVAQAAQPASTDALTWLRKMADAAHTLDYAGTFIYQHGSTMETSRIVHFTDASGDYEKLETLDGPPREIVRDNDNVTCYLPRSKTVLIDKGQRRRFPTLLPAQVDGITRNYDLHTGAVRRVAGHHCQAIRLTPKDKLRYGHEFCVETSSGLPLVARMYDENGKLIELFAFSTIKIGGITRDMLESKYAAVSGDWKIERSVLSEHAVKGDGVWQVEDRPAGFARLTEVQRMIAGQPQPVTHIVFSDGLAAVSVFIEPLPADAPRTGQSRQGAVNIVTRPVANHLVTVMGEVPAATIMQIANSLAFKGQ